MKKASLTLITTVLVVFLVSCQTKTITDVEHIIGFYNLFGESIEIVTKSIDFGDVQDRARIL